MGLKESGRKTIVVCHNTSRYLNLHYERMLKELLQRYDQVICVTPHDGYEDQLRSVGVQQVPIRINQHGMNPFQEAGIVYRLYRIYRHYKPETVLNFSVKPCLYGGLAARLARVPKSSYMITGLGYLFLAQSGFAKYLRWLVTRLYRVMLRRQDVLFFQNPDDAVYFADIGVTGSCRTVVLPGTGVDTTRFCADPPSPIAGAVRFLLIGRMLVDKGVTEYRLAAEKLRGKYPQAKFGLLGPIDKNPSALGRTQIDAWQKEGLIDYLGETEDVRPYLLQCDVFVLPSYREGLPRAGLEAMAMSRPVITSDVPGCRELVMEGENGYLVAPRNVESLVRAMESFLINPNQCHSMGQASRLYCCSYFDETGVSTAICDAVQGGDQK